MTLRFAWPRLSAALFATVAIYASGGCSFFYDLNTTQCEVTADCRAFGPQFATTTCVNRVCVEMEPAETGGSTSTGGRSGGTGGTSGGGSTGGGGDTGGDTNNGGTTGTGGTSGEGGEGGAMPPPECTTNTDCIEAHVDQPYICKAGTCVELITEQCPAVIPSNAVSILKGKKAPIVLGGFANMDNDANPKETKAVINWELAFDEFNTALGVGSSRPQMIGLLCQGNSALLNLDESMPHLTQDVGVTGILSTLAPDALAAAWDYTQTPEYADAKLPPVFFMSTGAADLRLADLDDSGLVWHLLGDPRVLAATTAALVKRIEPQVQAARQAYFDANPTAPGVENPADVPDLRVTLVYNDDPTMYDISKVLTTPDSTRPETMLTFNDATAIAAKNTDNYREVKVESANYHQPANVANGNMELAQHPPHIIIAMATSEFPSMMSTLEATWGKASTPSEGKPRPFYVLSHLLKSQATALSAPISQYSSGTSPMNMRTVGVAYALAQDQHSRDLYDAYLKNLKASYSGVLDVASTENYYDGAYGLLYSVMGAVPFTGGAPDGGDLRDAWKDHVIADRGTSVDIGPTYVADTVNKLGGSSYKMSLWGTMGPPNFDRLSGTRTSTTSAWCMLKTGTTWSVQVDGLIYDPATTTFKNPTTGAVPTCLAQY